jgi:hypothetical protein
MMDMGMAMADVFDEWLREEREYLQGLKTSWRQRHHRWNITRNLTISALVSESLPLIKQPYFLM